MKNKILPLIILGLYFSACVTEDEIIDLGDAPDPNILTNEIASGQTVVLDQDDADKTFALFTWTEADFGGQPVNYSIEMDKTGNNFAGSRDIITVKSLKDTLTVEEINAALILYGIQPGEAVDIDIRIRSWINFFSAPGYSNVLKFTLTPYELIFPPVYIIGDAQGWNLGNAVELKSTTPGIYTGKAKFQTNGKFRFFGLPDWGAEQWGWDFFDGGALPGEFADGEDGDSNFLFAGLTADYLITVSMEAKRIEIELAGPPPPPSSLFLVTAQTVDPADADELASVDSAVYEGILSLEANTKFRIFASQAWNAAKWGFSSFETVDDLLEASGDDVSNFLFTGAAGYYVVRVSLVDYSISLEATEAPAETLFLIGDPQGWQLDNTLAMRSLGGNVFEVIAEFETNQIFRFFKELDWAADQYRWSSFTGGTVDPALGDGGGGDSNFRFLASSGIYRVTVSLGDKTISVEPSEAPTLHMIGDDQGWMPSNAVSLTWMGGGKFQGQATFTNNAIFRFFADNDPASWDWNGVQWRYSSFEGGDVDAGNLGDGGGGDSNFRFIGTTGAHTITVNVNSLTIEID